MKLIFILLSSIKFAIPVCRYNIIYNKNQAGMMFPLFPYEKNYHIISFLFTTEYAGSGCPNLSGSL